MFCRLWPLLLLTALLLLLPPPGAESDDEGALPHAVQPGDTWAALALRYGTTPATLHALNPSPNRLQEPAIGGQVLRPDQPEQTGHLLRPLPGSSLTLTALAHALPPAQLLEAVSATWPLPHLLPWSAVLLPDPVAIPRDLPPLWDDLALSHIPARPGRGMVISGQMVEGESADLILTLTLGPLTVTPFRHATRLVAPLGTGGFFPPGDHDLTIRSPNLPLWSQPWRFEPVAWGSQIVTFTGAAAQIDRDAIVAERAQMFALWDQREPARPLWQGEWREPLDSYVALSADYGVRRSTDGGQSYRSYHEGVDYAAYGGTPVHAIAGGEVVLAQPLYVRGGSVVINHGLGIYSGYYHLSEINATVGTPVAAGELIGKVGTTGLSTGNHLHLDLLVGSSWVDAHAWLADGMACRLLAIWGEGCVAAP
jgi:hypothetical protein